ncbi:SAM-dependent methyltransferase [Lentzea sp. E54]|uniref:SAM-dependent methyltransferase n=1 Tax=Lentzea xerophila TaxID=3435883 RepID=UPI003DA5871B
MPLSAGDGLDLACGAGGDVLWLTKRGWRVTAVDISDTVVERVGDAASAAGVAERLRVEKHDLAATAKHCAHAPNRLRGLGLAPLQHSDLAVQALDMSSPSPLRALAPSAPPWAPERRSSRSRAPVTGPGPDRDRVTTTRVLRAWARTRAARGGARTRARSRRPAAAPLPGRVRTREVNVPQVGEQSPGQRGSVRVHWDRSGMFNARSCSHSVLPRLIGSASSAAGVHVRRHVSAFRGTSSGPESRPDVRWLGSAVEGRPQRAGWRRGAPASCRWCRTWA